MVHTMPVKICPAMLLEGIGFGSVSGSIVLVVASGIRVDPIGNKSGTLKLASVVGSNLVTVVLIMVEKSEGVVSSRGKSVTAELVSVASFILEKSSTLS